MKGFTILELLIAVAILAIVAGLAIPAMSGLGDEQKIKQAANNVADFINKTRMCAQSAAHRQATLTIDKDRKFLIACNDEGGTAKWNKFTKAANYEATDATGTFTLKGGNPLTPIDLSSVSKTIIFPSRGLLDNEYEITLSRAPFTCIIKINRIGTAEATSCR